MARPSHTLVTFSGVYGSSASPIEEWSFGVRFGNNRFTASSAKATTIAGFWTTHLAPLHTPRVNLTKVRIALVDAAGKYQRNVTDGGYLMGEWVGTSTGTMTGTDYPPQIACVVSLLSARPGPEGKGRIFLPYTGHAVSTTDLRLVSGDAVIIRDRVKSFLDAMTALDSYTGNPRPIVASTKGFESPVTSIRVGRALDTQRSRRSNLAEGYSSVALA